MKVNEWYNYDDWMELQEKKEKYSPAHMSRRYCMMAMESLAYAASVMEEFDKLKVKNIEIEKQSLLKEYGGIYTIGTLADGKHQIMTNENGQVVATAIKKKGVENE